MRHEVRSRSDAAWLRLDLDADEVVMAAYGTVALVSSRVRAGGACGAPESGSRLVSLTSPVGGERVELAPPLSGDVVHVRLDGRAWIVRPGAFLAAGPGVACEPAWGGSFEVGLRASGAGDLFLSAFGAADLVDLDGAMVAEGACVMAFEEAVAWVDAPVGRRSAVELRGHGRVWLQTRNPDVLRGLLTSVGG